MSAALSARPTTRCRVVVLPCNPTEALTPSNVGEDIVLLLPEKGLPAGWTEAPTGTVRGPRPILGKDAFPGSPIEGKSTRFLSTVSPLDRSNWTGTLTSPVFRLERRFLNFEIGGASLPGQVELLLEVKEGEKWVAKRASTGFGNAIVRFDFFDLQNLQGKEGRLIVRDHSVAPGGGLLLGSIVESDYPALQPQDGLERAGIDASAIINNCKFFRNEHERKYGRWPDFGISEREFYKLSLELLKKIEAPGIVIKSGDTVDSVAARLKGPVEEIFGKASEGRTQTFKNYLYAQATCDFLLKEVSYDYATGNLPNTPENGLIRNQYAESSIVLSRKCTTCMGYTQTAREIIRKFGISCIGVPGYPIPDYGVSGSPPHIWNIVTLANNLELPFDLANVGWAKIEKTGVFGSPRNQFNVLPITREAQAYFGVGYLQMPFKGSNSWRGDRQEPDSLMNSPRSKEEYLAGKPVFEQLRRFWSSRIGRRD